jgi:hypothetical protein
MPLNKKFNLVCFKVDDDGPRIFIQLEEEFTLSAGVAPNVNRAVVPYGEFDKLVAKDGIKDLGRVEFWFSDEPTRQVDPDDPDDEEPKPDHFIDGVRIVDVEPVKIGSPRAFPQRDVAARIIEYRLILADMRERFVGWRGGILTWGDVNSKTDPDSELVDNHTLIQRCLEAMGAIYQLSGAVIGDLNKSLPQRDLTWAGSAAPEELTKLLEYCRAALVVKSTAKLEIVTMGSGDAPVIPPDREVPGLLKMPGRGRRGKTVVFSSMPDPVIETITLQGPDASTWQFVARDKGTSPDDRPWKPLAEVSLYGNKGPTQMVKDDFKDVDPTLRDDLRADTYHYIRLAANKKNPKVAKLLRLLKLKKDRWGLPQVRAKVAVQQKDGTWKNANDLVSVHVAELLRDAQSGEPIIHINELMGSVEADGASSLQDKFKPLASLGDLEVRCSFCAVGKDGKHEFFTIGFTKEPDGLKKVDDLQVAALIEKADKDVTFLAIRELQLYRVDGEDQNRQQMEVAAKEMAEVFLRGSETDYQQRTAAGFLKGELDGLITEIRWDQNECKTTFKVNAWSYPLYIAGMRERLKNNGGVTFPAQHQSASSRLGLGSVGMGQPAVPVLPGPPPGGTATGGIDVWNCPNAKVVASARAERFAVGFSVSKITIEGADAAYVEHNFADSDEITIDQDPQGSLCPPIKWKQVPAGDSFDRVTNVFSTGDGIYKTTATRTQDFVKGGGADSDVQTSLVISIQDCPDAQAGSFAEAAAFGMSSNGFSGW